MLRVRNIETKTFTKKGSKRSFASEICYFLTRNFSNFMVSFIARQKSTKLVKNDFRSKKKGFQFDPSFFLKGA